MEMESGARFLAFGIFLQIITLLGLTLHQSRLTDILQNKKKSKVQTKT